MSEDKSPYVSAIELHEEFVQHMEEGADRMRGLALVTIVVAILLAASYVTQLVVLPFMMGVMTQTVNLLDPSLMVVEVVLLVLILLWLYVGTKEYLFTRRIARQIAEIREEEARLARKLKLGS
jgi:uncharacterized membrane protein (DUF373 family)